MPGLTYRTLLTFRITLLFVFGLFPICYSSPLQAQSSAQGGYAINFDATNDYVQIPDNNTLDVGGSDFAVEAWVYRTTNGFDHGVICKNNGSNAELSVSILGDKVVFYTESSAGTQQATSATDVTLGWTHIACVRTTNTLRIYINGVLDGTNTGTARNFNNGNILYIGAFHDGSSFSNRFSGKIDEVRIWNTSRTRSEIQANMHKALKGSESGLAAYYGMTNGSGTTVTDNSANTNNGTLVNGPTWKVSGAHSGPGRALDFDGTNDYVTITSTSTLEALTSTYTFEAWIKPTSLSSSVLSPILSKADQYLFGMRSDVIQFTAYGVYDYVLPYSLPTGTWTHVAMVFDASYDANFYVNGVLQGTVAGGGPSGGTPGNPLNLGSGFTGQMDEVRIWSDERTATEIRANMCTALAGDETDLVAYYRFDQYDNSNNTLLHDMTDNAQNGTLTNMDATSDWEAHTAFTTWLGADDGNFGTAANWSGGSIPVGTDNVGIHYLAGANYPNVGTTRSVKHFYLGASATFTNNGTFSIGGNLLNDGTFSGSGSTTFNGSLAQTLGGSGSTSLSSLVMNNSSGLTLAQNTSATGITFTSGDINLGGQILTLSSGATVTGAGTTKHVVATSGTLRKSYSGTGSFAFPVGDGTYYSPITLNFTSGSFASAYADVNVTQLKHPNIGYHDDYLNRYWTVSASGISAFDCSVSAQYTDADISGTESNLVGGKWNGSSWLELGAVTTASNLITATVSSFSDFTAAQSSAFPVEWLALSATPVNAHVKIDWATASELNSDYFGVESSTDQQIWSDIGTLKAAGTSTQTQDYSFLDTQPNNGRNFYRIRQVDVNGNFSYSAQVEALIHTQKFRAYPTPVTDVLQLELGAAQYEVSLLDVSGRVLKVWSAMTGNTSVSVNEITAGVYFIRVLAPGLNPWQQIVVKK